MCGLMWVDQSVGAIAPAPELTPAQALRLVVGEVENPRPFPFVAEADRHDRTVPVRDRRSRLVADHDVPTHQPPVPPAPHGGGQYPQSMVKSDLINVMSI